MAIELLENLWLELMKVKSSPHISYSIIVVTEVKSENVLRN